MRTHEQRQARVEQGFLAKRLLGHQVLAPVVQLALNVLGSQPGDVIGQLRPRTRTAIAIGNHLAQQAFVVLPQFGHVGRTALDVLGKGIGQQVIDILEIVGGGRQRHPRFGSHRPVSHATHTVTHDNPHGGVENVLPPLLTALPAGLAPLILNAFSQCAGHSRRSLLRYCTVQS